MIRDLSNSTLFAMTSSDHERLFALRFGLTMKFRKLEFSVGFWNQHARCHRYHWPH